jgi:hypothetical protein
VRALERAVRTAEPESVQSDALILARVVVQLDPAHERVLGIHEVDPFAASVILPTHLLEEWLGRLTVGQPDASALGEEPTALALHSEPPSAAGDPFVLSLTLSSDLVPGTVDGRDDLFAIRRLDASGWTAPSAPLTAQLVPASASAPAELRLSTPDDGFFVADGSYRLVCTMPIETPVVDAALRELSPRGQVHRFQLSSERAVQPLGGIP